MKYSFQQFEFDCNKRILTKNGEELPLHEKASQLLALFLMEADKIHSKSEILEHIWSGKVVTDQVIFQNISHLRALFGNDAIKTFIKKGYQWRLPIVEVVEQEPIEETPKEEPKVEIVQEEEPIVEVVEQEPIEEAPKEEPKVEIVQEEETVVEEPVVEVVEQKPIEETPIEEEPEVEIVQEEETVVEEPIVEVVEQEPIEEIIIEQINTEESLDNGFSYENQREVIINILEKENLINKQVLFYEDFKTISTPVGDLEMFEGLIISTVFNDIGELNIKHTFANHISDIWLVIPYYGLTTKIPLSSNQVNIELNLEGE